MSEPDHEGLERRLTQGLREIDGVEGAPDVSRRVLDRLGRGETGEEARGSRAPVLAAAAVVLMGLAVTFAVALAGGNDSDDPVSPTGAAAPGGQDSQRQDPIITVNPTPPVSVTSIEEIEKLPVTTRAVRGEGLSREGVLALRRLPMLVDLELAPVFGKLLDPDVVLEVGRLDKLVSLVANLGGTVGPEHLQAVASLPMMAHLHISTMGEWSDEHLAIVAGMRQLDFLSLWGTFECTPEGMQRLGDLEKLRRLTLTASRSRGQVPGAGLLDEHLAALPLTQLTFLTVRGHVNVEGAFLRGLSESTQLYGLELAGPKVEAPNLVHIPASVHRLTLGGLLAKCEHLTHLTNLEELDLSQSQVPVAFYVQSKAWPGCTVRLPGGALYEVPDPGKETQAQVAVQQVQLKMRTEQAYGDSAYSFRLRSRNPAVHKNYVDLVYGKCGALHFNVHGGMASRVLDLGLGKLDGNLDLQGAKGNWWKDSFVPKAGHVYAQFVSSGGQTMLVKFRVNSVSPQQVDLSWQPWDGQQRWPKPEAGRGAAGAMGFCDGPHVVR